MQKLLLTAGCIAEINSIVIRRFWFAFLVALGFWDCANGQQPRIAIPAPYQLQQPSIGVLPSPIIAPSFPNMLSSPGINIEEQNKRLLLRDNLMPGLTNVPDRKNVDIEVQKDIKEFKANEAYKEWLAKSGNYRAAFQQLANLNPENFSLTDAVYFIENAYYDNKLPYAAFKASIKQRAEQVRKLLKREHLSVNSNTALNYGIQTLYKQPILQSSSQPNASNSPKPFQYRFEDFEGEKDYTNMFVTKLLATNKGQCHSMPLLYLLIAEELGAKAFLSLAPQHSFIKFQDEQGHIYNFEATSGNIVSNTWITQSGYITAKALQNHTYFDTLSSRQLYAQMLNDLLLGYLQKFPYDDFAEQIRQKSLQANPNSMAALIVGANIATQIALQKIRAAGSPKVSDLPKYPEAYSAYLTMHKLYERVDATGYQDMPKEAYQKWLKSIEKEKKRQETAELRKRMQQEIRELSKSTFTKSKID